MADFLGSIRDPAHAPRVRAPDGVAALKLAAQASELAARTNP